MPAEITELLDFQRNNSLGGQQHSVLSGFSFHKTGFSSPKKAGRDNPELGQWMAIESYPQKILLWFKPAGS